METIFIYFIKASGLIGLFYLAYILLLRKETFFTTNRWFLLSGLITAVTLPLVIFTKIVWVEPTRNSFDWSNIPVTTTVANPEPEINWYSIASYVYILGTVLLLVKLLFDFYSLSKVFKRKTIKKQGNFKLIDVTENIAPFSFFKSIVYNSALYTPIELENILEHEKVHSSQNHSVDVLLSRLFCIAFWFNPLIWLYKKAIIQNLEFIADSEASKNISDKKAYQLTLLKITTPENCVAISNHFYQSLIKKRIIMLNQNQSKKWNSWKYITVFPALVAFVFFFQIEVVAQEKETPKQENDLNNLSKDKDIYINGEKSTKEELDKLNPNDIEKIDVAKVNNKKAILVTTKHLLKPFKITDKIIYIDGVKSTNDDFNKLDQSTVDKVDVNTFENTIRITTKKVNKNESKKDAENTIKNSNKTTNNTVAQLDDKTNVRSILKQDLHSKPLIIINGVKQLSNFKIEDIPTDQIAKIDVLKGIHAIEKYGESGKNGAIEITSKENTALNNPKPIQRKTAIGFQTLKQEETKNKNNTYFPIYGPTTLPPIIIMNGAKINSISNINEINPDAIKSMNVLKDKNAIEKYGDAGKYGAIEIITNTDDPSKIIKTPEKRKNDWIVGYSSDGENNVKSKIMENKSINYKKAVIVINGKQSDYKSLENLSPNEIDFATQADIKKAREEDRNKAIQWIYPN